MPCEAGANGNRAAELDGLRLVAIGRIPRCPRCPRYRALVEAYRGGGRATRTLPPVPRSCRDDVCAPIAARFEATAPRDEAPPWTAPRAIGSSAAGPRIQ